MSWNKSIIYEQPLNELARVSLRFEQLFRQLFYSLPGESFFDSRYALSTLLEIVNFADRPDLKASLAKEMSRLMTQLNQLQQAPQVDLIKLNNILKELDNAVTCLNNLNGKFAQDLRKNEFLNTIRLQLGNPGGAYCINNPSLNYWLHQSYEVRKTQLSEWLASVDTIREIIQLLLRIIRESGRPGLNTASKGFYELTLDPKQQTQLIRVYLPEELPVYPEISVGRHRVCIRFLKTNFTHRTEQTEEDISFKLSCCIV